MGGGGMYYFTRILIKSTSIINSLLPVGVVEFMFFFLFPAQELKTAQVLTDRWRM